MLVLARKEGEAITITTPEGIRARIILTKSFGASHIGVEAPKDWLILREELEKRTDKGGGGRWNI